MDQIEKELFIQIESGKDKAAFEMSTVQPRKSGLIYKVWLDDLGVKREINHNNLRLKYGPHPDDFVTVPFFEKKEVYSYTGKLKKGKPDMKTLSKWINLNYDNLVKFYKQEDDYDFVDFMFDMKSISNKGE